jgi:hypothetical protein
MAHGTFKPCPGCGEESYRSVNKVCHACEGLINAGRAVEAEKSAKVEKGRGKGKVYRLSKKWPGIYNPGSSAENRRTLEKALEELARAALKPLKSTRYAYDDGIAALPPASNSVHYCSYEEGASLWTCTQRLADSITKLDQAVRDAVLEAYEEGKTEGSNMLMALAKGEVSISELTEAQIEAGRRKKR